ncbi:hypothetical protein HN011_004427 [Eciton burchellii]|nr:hypothetical protein HN011_004427 [Eciton burchellii]
MLEEEVNLTNIYYSEKFFSYLKHYHLKSEWQEFVTYPDKRQLLEESITFFAQWMQPEKDISYADINAQLDNIAQKVMELLKITHPTHPIFFASAQQFSYWKCNNIDEDQWYFEDGKCILHILCKVLSKQWYLIQTSHDISNFVECHLINQVLRKTTCCIIPMIIIFQSTVRRLGICCNFMSRSDHHLLIWKPKYKTKSDNTQCFLINFHQDENVISINMQYSESDSDFTNNYNLYKRIDAIRVINLLTKCTEHLYYVSMHKKKQIRWLYEIQYLIEPENLDIIMLLYKYYLFYGKSMSKLMPTLKMIKDTSEDEERAKWASELLIHIEMYESKLSKIYNGNLFTLYQPKRRSANMRFLVGMIVNGLFKRQWLAGVIIGWLYLEIRPFVLCYIVLCENESVHYFCKDDLKLMSAPRPIVNSRIGEYFSEFKETYYVPNETLANAYPDDALYLLNEL